MVSSLKENAQAQEMPEVPATGPASLGHDEKRERNPGVGGWKMRENMGKPRKNGGFSE